MPYKFVKVGLEERFYARLIDNVILIGLYGALSIFGKSIGALLWYAIVFLPKDSFNKGRGVGKNYRDIVVINTDNYELCNYSRSALRNIASDLTVLLIVLQFGYNEYFTQLLFIITMLIDVWKIQSSEDGKRIGDLFAHTQVVYWSDYQKYLSQKK